MSDTASSRPPASSSTHVEEEEEESLEKLQAEIARMEEEAARIAEETKQLERQKAAKMASSTNTATTSTSNINGTGQTTNTSSTATAAANTTASGGTASKDACSIYVGQVDYTATPEELLAHFEACGTVERVTIVCDKFTGQPKGYAYLEFTSEAAVENAIKLNESTFKGRSLKVTSKRVNDPNFYYNQAIAPVTGGRGRGGFRGRGPPMHGRGAGYGAPPPPMMGAPPFRGGRGGRAPYRGGFRGGYAGGYHPYY